MSAISNVHQDVDDLDPSHMDDDASSNSSFEDDELQAEGDILLNSTPFSDAAKRDTPWPNDSEAVVRPQPPTGVVRVITDIDSLELFDNIEKIAATVSDGCAVLYGEPER